MDIGEGLKELRRKAGLSAKETAEMVTTNYGLELTDKTVYAYESGRRMPNADMFVALCDVYQCKDFRGTFGDIQDDGSIPSDDEFALIEMYRGLDGFGKNLVRMVIENEAARCKAQAQSARDSAIVEQIKKAIESGESQEKGDTQKSAASKIG